MLNKPLALLFVLVNHCVFPVYAGGAVPSGKEKPMIVKLTLHQQSYDVELADNPTAKAFIKQLPLTLTMQELNGNEKFADLPHPLPPIPSALKPSIRGISCYTVVILLFFYETFRTSYSYTPIGKVVAANKLQDAVGRGNIKVSFSMMK
jgi:hypothetical protein